MLYVNILKFGCFLNPGQNNSFSRGNNKFGYYFWIPIFGPIIGAIGGALVYKYVVGLHLDEIEKASKNLPLYSEKTKKNNSKQSQKTQPISEFSYSKLTFCE